MEEVRSSIEKIFDSFESSHGNMSAKRLNYSFLTNSEDEQRASGDGFTPSRKRRRGIDDTDISITQSVNSSLNVSNLSQSNQWEVRILKADLIEANSKNLQLKKEIDDRIHMHKNLEQLYQGKLKGAQSQLDASNAKAKEQEKFIKHVRKRSAADKEELVKLKNELTKQRQHYDEIVHGLRCTNRDLESNLRETAHNLNTNISTLSLQLNEAESELQATRDELNMLHDRQEELSDKAKNADTLTNELEQERYQLSAAQRKIKDLEGDLASYDEWKNLSKVFQARLSKVTDLERECERLTRDNKNLHETIGNKLLLEEQVHDLRARLETRERSSDTQVELKTQLHSLEQEVKDWKRLAKDFCLPNTPSTPMSLRSFIDDIQKKHLILTSDAGSVNREKASVTGQIIELRQQNEQTQKNSETLATTLRNYKTALHRMQKKLMLVARERDCFKVLLENYEKDLTITAPTAEFNIDSELKSRLDVVEKSLTGYKELCATLEQELEIARAAAGVDPCTIQSNSDQYEHLKKELDKLRFENERLQRRKDELELFVEQIKLKEGYGMVGSSERELKVVHMTMNPSEEAHDSYKNEVDKLRAEIERLKRKNRKLEEEHQDMTSRLNETTSTNMTTNIQEIGALRNQIQSLENKQQHYKEIYRAASLEFREVIYLLFGYRVDRIGNNNYRISSVYAENEDEYLNFRLNDMGELDMLESDYSLTLVEMVSNYLAEHHSMPAFLSSLTLDLFNRSTVAVG